MREASPTQQHKGLFRNQHRILKVWEEEVARAAGAGAAQTTCLQTGVKDPPCCL